MISRPKILQMISSGHGTSSFMCNFNSTGSIPTDPATVHQAPSEYNLTYPPNLPAQPPKTKPILTQSQASASFFLLFFSCFLSVFFSTLFIYTFCPSSPLCRFFLRYLIPPPLLIRLLLTHSAHLPTLHPFLLLFLLHYFFYLSFFICLINFIR